MAEPVVTMIQAPPCDRCGADTTMRTVTVPEGKGMTAGLSLTMRVFRCEHAHQDSGIFEKAAKQHWEGALIWGAVPEEYKAVTLAGVDWTRRDWAQNRAAIEHYFTTLPERIEAGDGYYLAGNRGTGKTMLACMVLNAAEAAGYPARFERVGHMAERLAKLQGDEWRQYRERIGTVRVLLLDELGSESPTAKTLEALTAVIDERHTGRRVTLTTTNLTGEELIARYRDLGKDAMGRLLDRLGQRNMPLTFRDASYRPQSRSEWWQAAREHAKAEASIPSWA